MNHLSSVVNARFNSGPLTAETFRRACEYLGNPRYRKTVITDGVFTANQDPNFEPLMTAIGARRIGTTTIEGQRAEVYIDAYVPTGYYAVIHVQLTPEEYFAQKENHG